MAKILIIEDDPYVRRMYERFFKFKKFDVYMASSGEAGLEIAKSVKPDLILLDIMMPVMNGFEVLKKLKSNPATSDIIVLMLTNFSEAENVEEAMKNGASGFLSKAEFEPENIINEVEKYLSKKNN